MEFYGLTDVGKKRQNNQDCFDILELDGCAILAVFDGMGGERGGDIASTMAKNAFIDICRREISPNGSDDDLISALHLASAEANRAVYEASLVDRELEGMGTTLAAVLLRTDNSADDSDVKTYGEPVEVSKDKPVGEIAAFVVNIGDSRTYFINEEEIKQLSKDHSYVQYLVDRGELSPAKAATHKQRNVLMKAVGTESITLPDIEKHVFLDGYILICSDGLYGEVKPADIKKTVLSDKTLKEKVEALIALANKKGGRDNITAVLAKI